MGKVTQVNYCIHTCQIVISGKALTHLFDLKIFLQDKSHLRVTTLKIIYG